MEIKTRFSVSADGYVTTPDGWPSLTADPSFVSGESHGFPEFQTSCEAVLMERTTFEPALSNDRWPWPDLEVFVLGHDVSTAAAPVPIVTDADPPVLLEKVRSANKGGDVHLVGGLQTIETSLQSGGVDKLGLPVAADRARRRPSADRGDALRAKRPHGVRRHRAARRSGADQDAAPRRRSAGGPTRAPVAAP